MWLIGLPRSCTLLQIKKAYRIQSLEHHPDKVIIYHCNKFTPDTDSFSIKGGSEEKFKMVAEAYSTLADPAERAKHDAELDSEDLCADDAYAWY